MPSFGHLTGSVGRSVGRRGKEVAILGGKSAKSWNLARNTFDDSSVRPQKREIDRGGGFASSFKDRLGASIYDVRTRGASGGQWRNR